MRAVAKELDVEAAVKEFAAVISRGLRIEALVLFGSYSSGEPHEWSDFDVAVISPDFEGMTLPERQETLARMSMGTDPRISPIGYPSGEYRNPPRHSFLREIIRTGRVLSQ